MVCTPMRPEIDSLPKLLQDTFADNGTGDRYRELSEFVEKIGVYKSNGDGGTLEEIVRNVVGKMIADGSLTGVESGGWTDEQINTLESAIDAFEIAKNDMAFRTAEGANSANTYVSIMRNLIEELRGS